MNVVTIFYETMLDMKYGNDKYGNYHAVLYNLSNEKMNSFKNESRLRKYIEFERTVVTTTDNTNFYIDAVPEDYFEFTEYELIEGTFPKTKDEICCSPSFLFQMGVPQDEFIGCNIMLGSNSYTVTGTYTTNRLWRAYSFNHVYCFTGGPENINSIAFELNTFNNCDNLCFKYETQGSYCEYNMNQLAIKRNTYSNREMYVPMIFIMFVVMLSIFIHCLSMFITYHKSNLETYRSIGVSRYSLRKALILNIIKTLISAAIPGITISIFSSAIVKKLYSFTYLADVSSHVYKRGLSVSLILTLFAFLAYSLTSYIIIVLRVKNLSTENLRNVRAVKIKKHDITTERVTNRYIVKKHIKNSTGANFITCITVCFLVCMIPMFKLYFSSVIKDEKTFEGFDYVAEIKESMLADFNNDEVKNYIDVICNPSADGCVSCPIYCMSCTFSVPKETISTEYAQLLKNNYEYNFDFNNKYSDTAKVPFIVVGITDERQKELDVKIGDNEAIAYRNIINNHNNMVGVKLENFSTIQLNEETTINIISVKNDYDDILPSSETANVLVININTYKKMFGERLIPQKIYYKVSNESINEFTALFAGKQFIKLASLDEVRGNNRHLNVCNIISMIILLLTFVFLVINCCVSVYINIQNNIKEYAIMTALGISKCDISIMVIYQVCAVMFSSLLLADCISLFISKRYYENITLTNCMIIEFPYMEMIISNLLFLLTCFILCAFYLHSFWKIATKQRINR